MKKERDYTNTWLYLIFALFDMGLTLAVIGWFVSQTLFLIGMMLMIVTTIVAMLIIMTISEHIVGLLLGLIGTPVYSVALPIMFIWSKFANLPCWKTFMKRVA